MSGNAGNRKAPLIEIAKAVGPILGIPLALFAIVSNVVEQPIIALVVALIVAVLASVWVVRSGWTGITEMIVAWLVLMVVILAGFVIWPRTMTVEGIIRDTTGNSVRNEVVVLFDRNNKKYETKTNTEGQYQFTAVPIGKYIMRVRESELEGETKGILVRVVQQNLTVPETLAAASPTPTPADLPSPTPSPSPTYTTTPSPTITYMPTPTPTASLSPTAIPPPTATSTYTPTPPPTPCSTIAIEESGVYCTESGSGGTQILAVEPPRPVARVRVDMAQRAKEYGDSLWEVEVYGPDSSDTNLAISGEACASSAQNDVNCQECFADKAIDGDVNTRWGSDWYDPQWLDISLPAPQVVNCVVLKWEEAYADQYCVNVIEPGMSEPRLAACPFEADTDAKTIVRLIQAESEAVNCENMSIIQAIFAQDAIIRDAVNGNEWHDPIARYQSLIANLDFRDLTHFDILAAGPGITETTAYYISGNNGQYRGGDGEWQSLYNGSTLDHLGPPTQYGSDHWTLQRNSAGCWVITEFTFNAGHIPFPP